MAAPARPLIQQAHDLGIGLLDFFYPPCCPLCQRRLTAEDHIICFRCRAEMNAPYDWQCPRCGAPGRGPAPEPDRPCRLCPPADAAWQGALAVTGYFDRSAHCVHLFKYNRRQEMGDVMAGMMADRLPAALRPLRDRLAMVMPVPIHWLRRMQRGFNQSTLLAETLAARLGLPCETGLLIRRRYTRRQALVPHEQRRRNVEGAFAVPAARRGALEGRGILIVDDVMTTGETVGECARVLLQAGAREIWIASFARAGLGGPPDDEWLHDPAFAEIL